MSIYSTPIENAPGVEPSSISALKMLFNGDSADGSSNVITDIIGGLTVECANSVTFTKGAHGVITSGATGAFSTLVGTLPSVGNSNFLLFGRFLSKTQSIATGRFDFGDYYDGGGYGNSGGMLAAGTAVEASDGTTGYLGYNSTSVEAIHSSLPTYIAALSHPATTSTFVICTPEGVDDAPNSTGGTSGQELNAGIGPSANKLILPHLDNASDEGGPYGLLVMDQAIPSIQTIQRGLQWMTTYGCEKMPPMWESLV